MFDNATNPNSQEPEHSAAIGTIFKRLDALTQIAEEVTDLLGQLLQRAAAQVPTSKHS